VFFSCFDSVALLLLRQRRVAAGSGMDSGLGTMIKYART
jgi:hypothetical protein